VFFMVLACVSFLLACGVRLLLKLREEKMPAHAEPGCSDRLLDWLAACRDRLVGWLAACRAACAEACCSKKPKPADAEQASCCDRCSCFGSCSRLARSCFGFCKRQASSCVGCCSRQASKAQSMVEHDAQVQILQQDKELREQHEKDMAQLKVSPHTDVYCRIQHAMLILGSLLYFKLVVLQLQALSCSQQPDPKQAGLLSDDVVQWHSYLIEDGSTRCWQGGHAATFFAVIVLFLGFTLGFPAFCFVLLARTVGHRVDDGITGWILRHLPWLKKYRVHDTHKYAEGAAQGATDQDSDMHKQAADEQPGLVVKVEPAAMGAGVSAPDGSIPSSSVSHTAGKTEPLASNSSAVTKETDTSATPGESASPVSQWMTHVRVLEKQKSWVGMNKSQYLLEKRRRRDTFGALFEGWRTPFFAIALLPFLSQFIYALAQVFSTDALSRAFVQGLTDSLPIVYFLTLLPFNEFRSGLLSASIGIGGLAYTVLMLGVIPLSSGHAYMYLLLLVLALEVWLLLFRWRQLGRGVVLSVVGEVVLVSFQMYAGVDRRPMAAGEANGGGARAGAGAQANMAGATLNAAGGGGPSSGKRATGKRASGGAADASVPPPPAKAPPTELPVKAAAAAVLPHVSLRVRPRTAQAWAATPDPQPPVQAPHQHMQSVTEAGSSASLLDHDMPASPSAAAGFSTPVSPLPSPVRGAPLPSHVQVPRPTAPDTRSTNGAVRAPSVRTARERK